MWSPSRLPGRSSSASRAEHQAGSSVATRRSAGRLATSPASDRDECALPHRTFGGRLLRFRGEPGPQRRREPAPWPDMLQPPDVRLPHQDALSHASTEQPAAAMAITPGAHMAGGPRSGAGIPRRAWPAAAPCARALARHAATPGRALAASGCVISCSDGAACPRTPAPGPAHAFGGGITDAPGRIARRRRRGGAGMIGHETAAARRRPW